MSVFIVLLIIAVFYLFRLYLKRKSKHLLEIVKLNYEHQQNLTTSEIEMQDKTLRFVVEEWHDHFGQVLALIRIRLNMLKTDFTVDKYNEIDEIENLINNIIYGIKDMAKSLQPAYEKTDFFSDRLIPELKRIESTRVYETKLEVIGTEAKLDPETEVILFRMTQEILNNILKHAGANRIDVSLTYYENGFSFSIKDNGRGFDFDNVIKSTKGIGLKSLKNRADMIGAAISFKKVLNEGMVISIDLPKSKYA